MKFSFFKYDCCKLIKSMKLKFICFLIFIICTLLFKRSNAQTYTLADTILAQQYELKADSFFSYSQTDSAKQYQKLALEIYKDLNQQLPENKRVLGCYYLAHCATIADFGFNRKKSDSLLSVIQDISDKASTFFGEKSIELGKINFYEGLLYLKSNKYVLADSCFTISLQIRVLTDTANLFMAKIYHNAGISKYYQGNYKESLKYYQKSLLILLRVFGEQHPDVAASYNNIGNAFLELGNYKTALEYHQKSLQSKKKIFGEKHLYLASTYNNIGNVFNKQGVYDKALEYYQKSLQIRLKLLGELHPELVSSYNNIGVIYGYQGHNEKALEYYQKSLQIQLKTFGEINPNVATSYSNIGIVFNYQGHYEKALDYYQKSLQIKLKTFGEHHPDVASSYNRIGVAYSYLGQYEKALEYYQKSLLIRLKIFGEHHPDVASSYMNIGFEYSNLKNHEKALEYYQKSLLIFSKVIGTHHPTIAMLYQNIGIIYVKQWNNEKALEFYQKSLCSNNIGFNDSVNYYRYPIIKNYLNAEVLLSALQGKSYIFSKLYEQAKTKKTDSAFIYLNAAYTHYQLCDTVIRQQFNSMTNPADALSVIESSQKIYEEAILTASLLFEETKDNKYLESAYYFASTNKSRLLQRDIYVQNGLKLSDIPDSLNTMDFSLKYQINNLNQQIITEPDSVKKANFQSRLFDLNRNHEAFTALLEKDYPKYYNLKYSNKITTINEIQTLLPDNNTALIEYNMSDSILTSFVIRKDTIMYSQQSFDSTFIQQTKQFLVSIKNFNTPEYIKIASDLYDKLVKPLEPFIGERNRLIIIPSSYLINLPFEALLTHSVNSTLSSVDETSLPFAIKKYEINYHSSSTLWAEEYVKNNSVTSKGLMAFAPVFSQNDTTGYIVNKEWIQSDTLSPELAVRSSNSGKLQFNELKYSKDEVNGILSKFKKKNSIAFIGKEASEKQFREQASKYNIIHIASHSFINNNIPEMSGISFSQINADSSDTNNDGILFCNEAYNLSLNADLLVLSSCESGNGRFYKGEGVMSLTRGFLYAGCRNILYSIWKVYDKQTSSMMNYFYEYISKNNTYSKALQQAKLDMIKDPKTAHPKYWAGFVLIGK